MKGELGECPIMNKHNGESLRMQMQLRLGVRKKRLHLQGQTGQDIGRRSDQTYKIRLEKLGR